MLIILLDVRDDFDIYVRKGDNFNLSINRGTIFPDKIIRHEIKQRRHITYAASFVFAQEDGSVQDPNVCGIFGDKDDLPKEIKDATHWQDLKGDVRDNFLSSSNLSVKVNT